MLRQTRHSEGVDLTRWSWDPAIIFGVALSAALYARGWLQLKHRHTTSAACFAAGLAVVVIALCSPIGVYDGQLFSLHMTEHLLLALVAAPLLLLGKPLVSLVLGLPRQERRGAARLLKVFTLVGPRTAVALYVTAFAVWHLPALYNLAQGQTPIHYLEHATFFATALLFWYPVIHPDGGPRRLPKIAGALYFAPAMVEGTLIGALFTFASRPLYATYSSIDDQQLAGLIMWIPGGLVYAAAVLALLMSVLREEERACRTTEMDMSPIARDDAVLFENA